MNKFFNKIKNTFSKINYRSKKFSFFIVFLAATIVISVIYFSSSYYIETGTKTSIISGSASLSDYDVALQIYTQDRDSSGNAISGSYSRSYFIPRSNYTYDSSKTVCGSGIEISYDSVNYKFSILSSSKGMCKVYFNAEGTFLANNSFSLNVEQTLNGDNYKTLRALPDNDYVYEVNTSKTTCTDPNAEVSILNRKIRVKSTMDLDCDIYVDIQSYTGGSVQKYTILNQEMYEYGLDANEMPYKIVNDNGIRFVGQNPNNYVLFNGERWRIIGVFEELYSIGNSVPSTTGNLVKIIRESSIGSLMFDLKKTSGTGTSGSNGSNDWSDGQLMMLLNPTDFLNTGRNNNTVTHSHTVDASGQVLDSNSKVIYKNMGALYTTSTQMYAPAFYGAGGSPVTYDGNITRIDSTTRNMIATVRWHLGGTNSFTNSSNGLVTHWYNYERGTKVFDSTGNGITRATTWDGLIGLMYPSDYGYATMGTLSETENNVVLNRDECLTHEISKWRLNDTSTTYFNCATTDWLLYSGATSNKNFGSPVNQWTFTPSTDNSIYNYYILTTGRINTSTDNKTYEVRPTLYLNPNVTISGGSGTYADPYTLTL